MTEPQKCSTEGCGGKAKRWGRCQRCGAPPEVREKALAVYQAEGCAAAAKVTGLSMNTVGRWARIAGLPYIHRRGLPDEIGLTGKEAAEASGASYRQVDYWQSSGFIQPTVQPEGSGFFRRYSPEDVERLRVAVGLINAGMLKVLSAEGFAA